MIRFLAISSSFLLAIGSCGIAQESKRPDGKKPDEQKKVDPADKKPAKPGNGEPGPQGEEEDQILERLTKNVRPTPFSQYQR